MPLLKRHTNPLKVAAFNIFFLFQGYLLLTIPAAYSTGAVVLCICFLIVYNYLQLIHKNIMRIHGCDLYIYSLTGKNKVNIHAIHAINMNHSLINRLLDINTIHIRFIDGKARKFYVREFERDKAEQFIKEHIIYQ